jgi:hypothetical protein
VILGSSVENEYMPPMSFSQATKGKRVSLNCAKKAKWQEQRAKRKRNEFFSHESSLAFLCSVLFAPCSLLFDDSIRPHQHLLRDRQTDLFRRLQVDYKFEFSRLLDGKIGGFGAFQYFIDVRGGAAK